MLPHTILYLVRKTSDNKCRQNKMSIKNNKISFKSELGLKKQSKKMPTHFGSLLHSRYRPWSVGPTDRGTLKIQV